MLPSPSRGSPPKWRGASWKFSISALTTTAVPRWTAPLRGEMNSTVRRARDFGAAPARRRRRRRRRRQDDEQDDGHDGAEHGEDWGSCRAWEPEHYVLLRAAMSSAATLAYRIGAAARRPASWLQLVKFGLVGGSGYLINLAVFAVLSGSLGLHHVAAAIGAFCVAVTNNFLLNRHWTFAAGDGHAGFQAMRFFAVSIAALLINLVALEALVSDGRARRPLGAGDRRRDRDAVQLPRQQALDLRLAAARRVRPTGDERVAPDRLVDLRESAVENEGQQQPQPWALIAIAALGLVIGAIALIVAFGAKSDSEDAAKQASVAEVQTELSNLVDRLGIAEKTLNGDAQAANGKAQQAARESRNAAINLSNRIDRLERQTAKLKASAKQTAALTKEVGALDNQVSDLRGEVATLNQRVTKLTKRFNSATASANESGGKSAP